MADNDTQLKEWLDSLTLSDSEKQVFESVLKDEKRGKNLKDSVLMKADYSRSMNELKAKEQALQTEIQKKQQELEAHQASLVNWKGTADKTLAQIQRERDEAVTKLATVQARAKTISENYGIDPKEILPDEVTPQRLAEAQPRGDDGRFVKTEDFQKAVSDVMQFPQVSAELIDIFAEHTELFGKPLRGARELVQEAMQNKRTIRDQWAEKFKVADRKAEIDASQRAAEEQRIRTDERNKVLSEVKIPIPRPSQAPSPLFQSALPKPTERPTDTASSQRAIDAAMRAYNEGTFKDAHQTP